VEEGDALKDGRGGGVSLQRVKDGDGVRAEPDVLLHRAGVEGAQAADTPLDEEAVGVVSARRRHSSGRCLCPRWTAYCQRVARSVEGGHVHRKRHVLTYLSDGIQAAFSKNSVPSLLPTP
jgi:hypothetical protein